MFLSFVSHLHLAFYKIGVPSSEIRESVCSSFMTLVRLIEIAFRFPKKLIFCFYIWISVANSLLRNFFVSIAESNLSICKVRFCRVEHHYLAKQTKKVKLIFKTQLPTIQANDIHEMGILGQFQDS